MGLDGISINQLRVTPENNSAELNNQVRFNLNSESRVIDGLSQGQRINPDEEHEKEKQQSQNKGDSSGENNEEEESEEITYQDFDTIKYDLSKSDKYALKVEESTNNILIIEKSTKNIVQRISADELSTLARYLSNSQGSIISKRY